MTRLRKLVVLMALAVLALSSVAMAEKETQIELRTSAEVEVQVVTEDGATKTERVEAAKVVPGDEVIYTIHYANVGNEVAENVVITDPVPEHMLYRDGSASCEGATVTFSVDGGETFGVAGDLKVPLVDGGERPAGPSDYTHIKWLVDGGLKPHDGGFVSFRALLQ